jgi:hypothetical protein
MKVNGLEYINNNSVYIPLSYISNNVMFFNNVKTPVPPMLTHIPPTQSEINGIITTIATTPIKIDDALYLPHDKLSNSEISLVTSIQSKSFPVALNIEDCTYSYYSEIGTSNGYFIVDSTPALPDNGNDLSGFQYATTVFSTYMDDVMRYVNPAIEAASNAANEMYNAFATSRLATYGYLNSIYDNNIPDVYNVEYDTITVSNVALSYSNISSMMSVNPLFVKNIYDVYSSLYRYMLNITS